MNNKIEKIGFMQAGGLLLARRSGTLRRAGGGVSGKSAYAVMWKVPFLRPSDFPELITHESGHVFQLDDTFNDTTLGNPPQSFSRHNYMDYYIPRNMFFKSQIKIMFNQKNPRE